MQYDGQKLHVTWDFSFQNVISATFPSVCPPLKSFSRLVSSDSTFLAEKGEIKCDVPSVKLRENTRLTCYFPEDVSQTRRDFSVYRQIGMETEAVIDCWWLRGRLNCYVDPHYKYDKKISDRLTVEIQRVSPSHIGTYSCHLANYIQDSLNTCDLSVTIDRSVCEIPSAKLESQTVLTCYFPEDLSKTQADFSVYHYSSPDLKDTVLSCTWNGDSLSCDTVRGYQFDKKVTSHLRLRISKVLENHQGTYSCRAQGDVLCENCSFALKTETTSSCHVPSVPEMEPTTLTCNFSVDVSATRRDFRVIHFNSQDKKGGEILSCTWTSDQLFCNKAPGFEFNKSVTDHLFIEVPQARQEHNGSYVCYLEGSDRHESCDFIVMTASQNTDNAAAVSVGVIITLLIIVALIVVIVFVFKRRSRTRKENTDIEANEDMLSQMSEADSDCFQKKYPGYESKSYYVPPLYFNRNTYTTFRIAGEDVSVTEFPDDHTVKLDQAMSTILQSFRLLGKKHIMFVISQFDYDDCLEYLRQDSSKRREVKNYGDFDVLIVHRRYGVLFGVVMTCSDETNKMVMVKDLEKSCQQLDNAYQMLVDLTTDQEPKISIHKLLILPNLQHKSLKSVFRQNTNAKKVLADCLELSKPDNVHQKCLCADDLQGNNRTQKLGEWLEKQVSTSQECIPDDKYVEVLERFCGHSIKMPLIPRGILPTTLRAAVNVTGNLFSLPILQPEQRDALQNLESQPSVQEPPVFLSGPPASGKTRTLVLTGKQWLYDGHDVHVVSTWRGSRTASSMIHAELSKYVENMATSREMGRVILQDFELKTKKVDSYVNKLSEAANGNVLYIIADETGPYEENHSTFKAFAEGLIKKVPQLHFWAASCFKGAAPDRFENPIFSDSFTAPPAILMHEGVTKLVSDCGIHAHTRSSRTIAPTEGPPVKLIKHKRKNHQANYPWECETCANAVVDFLQTLDICCEAETCPHMTDASQHLHYSDVLVMFETDSATNLPLCKKLKENVEVKILEEKQTEVVTYFMSGVNQVVVAKWHHILGIKKKVVVYLGGDPKLKKKPTKATMWKRLRGLTSSSSLLIWVTGDKFNKDADEKEKEEEEEKEEEKKEEKEEERDDDKKKRRSKIFTLMHE